MSTSLIPLLAYALLSALVAALRHPGDAPGAGPALLRFLGALSCLRFRDAPGAAISLPFVPQRAPDPDEPAAVTLEAMASAARRTWVRAPNGDDVWRAVAAAVWAEWQRRRLMRDLGAEPPHDPAIPPLPVERPPQPPRAGTIITSVALLVVLGLAACAGGWQASLARCGLQMAPAGVQDGVALALRGGEGWQDALARLVLGYGECVVRAEVQRHADGQGPEPPSAQAHALTVEGHGELAARPRAAVTREVAQGRARLALAGWQDVVRIGGEVPR